jgi:acetyl esterase/lipase
VRGKLDPQYAAFHDAHLQYIQPSESFPWDPAVRGKPGMPPCGSPALEVGGIRDIALSEYSVRAFTPVGNVPDGGWPVCIWFHGGMLDFLDFWTLAGRISMIWLSDWCD